MFEGNQPYPVIMEMEYMRAMDVCFSYAKRNKPPEPNTPSEKVHGYERAFFQSSTPEQEEIKSWIAQNNKNVKHNDKNSL